MKVKVEGGTHLGIVGCYGVRTFNVKSVDEIEKIIRKEEELEDSEKSSYKTKNGTKIHTLVNKNNLVLFEWRIISVGNNNND
ncbi:MAG: hypothetical protein ACFFG0_00400 [Candidatus Thorarchaeota archaeon]